MKRFQNTTIAFVLAISLTQASATPINGYVADAKTGEAIIGASIIYNNKVGAVTDTEGHFQLDITTFPSQISVSYVGYENQQVSIAGGDSLVDIRLQEDTRQLSEVVVVGYGTQKAKDLTAPIVNIKGDELSKQATANPMSALAGMVSGVQITQSGAPGAGPSVKIRGVGSIGDYAKPLYVVDGAFMDNIDFLASSDIESLTVLKDASASAIYGVRAANGVIIVTTRKGEMGHARVSYDGYAGVQVPTNIMKLANTDQYCELYNLAFDGTTGFVPKDPANYKGVSTDWYATLVHPALTHSHSLDLRGGTEKTNYSVGLSYFFQDGIMNFTKNNYGRLNRQELSARPPGPDHELLAQGGIQHRGVQD